MGVVSGAAAGAWGMPWATHHGRRYYYRSVRVDGRPQKVYAGSGANAVAAAAEVAERRRAREHEAEERRAESARVAAAEARLDELCRETDLLLRGLLLSLGFRQHDRGQWRRRRGDHGRVEGGRGGRGEASGAEGTSLPEVAGLIERVAGGEEAAVADLRRALENHPELAAELADLAALAEDGLIRLAAGTCGVGRAAIAAHVAGMRAELGEAGASPLERLLIGRVVLCWLACHAGEVGLVEKRLARLAEPSLAAAERRVDRAHARLLSAARTLATVRKLIRPGLSAVELARAVVPEARPAAVNRVRERVAAN